MAPAAGSATVERPDQSRRHLRRRVEPGPPAGRCRRPLEPAKLSDMTTQRLSSGCAAGCGSRPRTWAAAVAGSALVAALIQLGMLLALR